MPWHETEALFLSTVEAAQEASPNSSSAKDLQIIDLGEAGRQEIWQNEAVRVSKTIAKHGGKSPTPPASPLAISRQDGTSASGVLSRVSSGIYVLP